MERHSSGGGRQDEGGPGATPLRMVTAAAGGSADGVARRMFSRPRLENGGRRSVLGHMLFNKL